MMTWRIAALLGVIVSVAILSVQPMFHGLMRKRVGKNAKSIVIRLRDMTPSAVKPDQGNEFFAPIIIGAGKGTTGTHLIAETTCDMGFVSLHYNLGCLPKHAMSLHEKDRQLSEGRSFPADAGTDDVTEDEDDGTDDGVNYRNQSKQEISCPVPFDHFLDPYRTLVRYHLSLSRMTLNLSKSNTDPVSFRKRVLRNLEGIIAWGKEHKVVVALHDEPYPQLLPEILKMVQNHYGNPVEGEKNVTVKPIILLSERDPREYTERRTYKYGGMSCVCRPTKDQIGENSATPIIIEPMNATTLEGGAFDMIGCLNRGAFNQDVEQTQKSSTSELFYTFKEAGLLEQSQFVVDSMENYQITVRGLAMLSYNMFEQKDKTAVTDMADQVKRSMTEALVNENGSQTRMKDGLDFLGLKSFLAGIDRSENAGDRTTHRRRDHGDVYAESPSQGFASPVPTAGYTKMVLVNLWQKQLIPQFNGRYPKCKKIMLDRIV